ncbi:SDR family oxidoreductase [Lawsonella clevelandensis]|uniref:SDR family oxidoreductase n=1 Tax=Lawsonella clevelandensis TaxID=1528099 RepID=UPI0032D9508A
MELGLTGRKAIVTGSSKGLGYATAQELLKEGASVVICARNAQEVEDAVQRLSEYGQVDGTSVDVRDAGKLDRFIDFAVQKLGGIDIIVNNAGGAHPGSGETLDDDALLADYNIKVLSWQRIIRRTLPYLRQSDQARIITIGSVYQHSPDYRFFSTSVHRAAGANLTQAWAAELAKDNILVNSINIGCIHTPQWDNIHQKRNPELSTQEFLDRTAAEDIPLGRFGEPEELAAAVAFLASERASYITGAILDVAGGMGLRFGP